MPNKRAVSADEDLVRLYLDDVGRRELLSREDEARLARAVEAGRGARAEMDGGVALDPRRRRQLRRTIRDGDDATTEFIEANLRLVVSIAKRYQSPEMPLLDLVQEGNLGLMHAVERFDWRKGFKFSTYATWWIRQSISRGIANQGRTVRLPVHAGDLLAQVGKARSRLEAQHGRRPSTAEIAAHVGVGESKVIEVMRFAGEPLSLSAPISAESDTSIGDLVEDRSARSPFQAAAAAMLQNEVEKMLVALNEREREIIRLRFGLDRGQPRTLDEIGAHFHLTRERIRQIEARAMSKLRHPTHSSAGRELIDDYDTP